MQLNTLLDQLQHGPLAQLAVSDFTINSQKQKLAVHINMGLNILHTRFVLHREEYLPDPQDETMLLYPELPSAVTFTEITETDIDDAANVTVDVPDAFLQALVLITAAQAHYAVSSPENDGQGANYEARFEQEVFRLTKLGWVVRDQHANYKLENNGWV